MAVQKWSDLHHDIKQDAQGGVKKVVDIESVLTSIDNILGTRPGERVMLPQFSSALQGMLFEPITSHLRLKVSNEVKRTIERWDDRVKVTGVDYSSDPDRSAIFLTISFRIRGYPQQVFTYTKSMVTGGV